MTYRFLIAGAFALSWVLPVVAQTATPGGWPAKPVRIIVPFAPGGSTDNLARSLAQRLTEVYKQSFVVENRPGAGGTLGSAMVAKSVPDGYTLLLSSLASQVIGPVVQKNVPYEAVKDWTHIALLGGPPTLLMVYPGGEVHDYKGFVEWAKRQPGGIPFATPGVGTHAHLLGELYGRQSGIKMAHAPYKGSGPAAADLIAGHIQTAFLALAGASGHVRAGKMRPLATTSAKRMAELPDVPTFAELGFRDMTAITWFGLAAPAGLPEPTAASLNLETRKAMASADLRQRLASEGIEPNDLDVAQFTAFVRDEAARWQPVARNANIRAD